MEEYGIIGEILSKYPVITDEEQKTLKEWLAKDGNQARFNAIVANGSRKDDLGRYFQIRSKKEVNREKYQAAIAEIKGRRKLIWWNRWQTYVAAASVMAIAATFIFLYNNNRKAIGEREIVATKPDIAPGTAKATLKLADGKTVVLDSAAIGQLTVQGGTEVVNNGGQLVYAGGKVSLNEGDLEGGEVLYNTLSTSKGQTYPLLLSDGSRIILNSESSIRFSVNLVENPRKVEVTGEIYFEIAHDVNKPFIVLVNGIEVKVLGTHFNINAYADEGTILTTLIEGKVKVFKNGKIAILKPGQQAQVPLEQQQGDKDIRIVDHANIDEVMAWKNGRFYFNNATISNVMRQMERWYNIEVVYEGEKPTQMFGGELQRNLYLSQVIRALEHTGVHFKIEGRKLMVMQ